MADYISREAAIETAEHAYHAWNLAMGAADGQRQINRCFKMQELCKVVVALFANATAADVEPVRHGRWVEHKPGEQHRLNACIECSKCNIWFGYDCFAKTNYCPNCGAKMDLEDENEV